MRAFDVEMSRRGFASALAAGALRVLRGEEEPKHYTGRPVWDGWHDDD